jgi:O-glycosyl hydrolase
LLLVAQSSAQAQSVTIDTSQSARDHQIDGFGVMSRSAQSKQAWWQNLLYDDLGASILRVDLTPAFVSPYSDNNYNSPPFNTLGPDNDYAHPYTSATDYTSMFNGHSAQIAVMGPNIDDNVKLLNFAARASDGAAAKAGADRATALGGFKLFGSMLSPAPWLKISSGHKIGNEAPPLPSPGTPWPFIWLGNFSGGYLDTSGTALAVFNDGTGPTSALTQYARSLAAWLRGFQNTYQVQFYGISLQNELNFEEFYDSCSYPLASQYIAVLKAARAELDKYDDLKNILIMGPEDLLGNSAYGLWQFGSGTNITHKNLQYLSQVAADPVAASALGFFNIHGYAPDGITAAGSDPQEWIWWRSGWTSSPAAGLPAMVAGFQSYGKKSWMTETSGEQAMWLGPLTSGFPAKGAFSILLKIHEALTTGQESAWVYLSLSQAATTTGETLTDPTTLGAAVKYTAAKHFFKYIRPGSWLVKSTVDSAPNLLASSYVNDATSTLTSVLINTASTDQMVAVHLPSTPAGITQLSSYTSSNGNLWQSAQLFVTGGQVQLTVPAYGVATLVGAPQGTGGAGSGGGAGGSGTGGGAGNAGGSGTGASAGNGGSGGSAGNGGSGGNAGNAGTGGNAGSAGTGGNAGAVGNPPQGGQSGAAGSTGSAGSTGGGAMSGNAGANGIGGTGKNDGCAFLGTPGPELATPLTLWFIASFAVRAHLRRRRRDR